MKCRLGVVALALSIVCAPAGAVSFTQKYAFTVKPETTYCMTEADCPSSNTKYRGTFTLHLPEAVPDGLYWAANGDAIELLQFETTVGIARWVYPVPNPSDPLNILDYFGGYFGATFDRGRLTGIAIEFEDACGYLYSRVQSGFNGSVLSGTLREFSPGGPCGTEGGTFFHVRGQATWRPVPEPGSLALLGLGLAGLGLAQRQRIKQVK